MKDKQETTGEKELGLLFQQMRREDAAQLPDFPDAAVLAGRETIALGHRAYSAMPKFAAAAAVALMAILLLREPVPQDPAMLYAEVMNANSIATDTLLLVSPGTLPGMVSLPDDYELDFSADAEQNIN